MHLKDFCVLLAAAAVFSEGFEPDFGNGVQRFAYRAVSGSLFFAS